MLNVCETLFMCNGFLFDVHDSIRCVRVLVWLYSASSQTALDHATDPWGVKVERVEV